MLMMEIAAKPARKQKNVGSGDSANFNCTQNLIKAGVGQQACEPLKKK
jgi:hypothetical protein